MRHTNILLENLFPNVTIHINNSIELLAIPMVACLKILLVTLVLIGFVDCFGLRGLWRRVLVSTSVAVTAAQLGLVHEVSAVDLKEQLVKLQSSQVDEQNKLLIRSRDKDSSRVGNYVSKNQIAKAVISLPPPPDSDLDPSQYPLGLTSAQYLNANLAGPKAAMIVTAVGRDGPPLAAKKIPLRDLQFPVFVELTTSNLIFPYNEEIWQSSPISEDSVSIACVLDEDGVLSTNEDSAWYGFAISDVITNSDGKIARREAALNVNLQSDSRQYDKTEMDLVGRVDNELTRIAALK